jgi:multiple sugar transport system permease protein
VRRRLVAVVWHAALVVCALLTAFPLLWMVSASFMAPGEANAVPPPLFPAHPTGEHYTALFSGLRLGGYLVNSVLVSVGATLVSLLLNSLAGYAFAKLRFSGRDLIFRVLVAGMVIPAQVAMLPLFLLLKWLGLVNTLVGVALPGFASIFGIFLVRQYALSIPDDLLDAARIDGASEMRIYRTVVLPLMRPVLVSLALFTFMGTWNDFMWPLIILTDDAKYTLPVALASLSGEHVQDTELMMAGATLTVAPVLGLFLLLQRHYVQGIMLGGVKG